jgi:Concanavalin A-like lectin/glucanases superfamily
VSPRGLRWLLLALLAAGCGRAGRSYLLLTSRGHQAIGARSLHLAIQNGGGSATVDITPTQDPYPFSLSFDPERRGVVDIAAQARGAGNATVGEVIVHPTLDPGGVVPVELLYAGAPPDLRLADLSARVDSAIGADLRLPADLAAPIDISGPQPDLRGYSHCIALIGSNLPGSGGNAGPSADCDFAGPFTVEAWVRVTGAAGNTGTGLANHGSIANMNGWALELAVASDKPEFHLFTTANNVTHHQIATSNQALAVNRWTHVAGQYDGGTIRIFVDGVQTASTAVTGTPLYQPNTPLLFGDRLPGYIDELRVSAINRYAAGFQPLNTFAKDPDTTRLYHFDAPSNTVTLDVINNADANLAGGATVGQSPCP